MAIERPEGYKQEKRDCTVRALATAANLPYPDVHSAFKKFGRKDKSSVASKFIFQDVCKELNLNATQVKRSGSVEKFLKLFPKGHYYCRHSGHAFAVIDGVMHDGPSKFAHLKGAWLITKQEESE